MKKLLKISLVFFTIILLLLGSNIKPDSKKPVKNVILLIGDGMGISQVYAGMTQNQGWLYLEEMPVIGLVKTYSSSDYVTDSGAGGTAFSTGYKTYNGAIGVDSAGIPRKTILEYAEEAGKATGLISTSSITHATPASFIAHQASRSSYEDIAADFLKTDIDLFIGGGLDHFAHRSDSVDLTKTLVERGYQVITSHRDLLAIQKGKIAGLTAAVHHPRMLDGRGDLLAESVDVALRVLSQDPDGFFLMVEGSMIDWGSHDNDLDYLVSEMVDFDRAIKRALDFAKADGKTLVVVTSDHETGGLGLNAGNRMTGEISAGFTTPGHTATLVPLFAMGPRAGEFSGIQENTDIFSKMFRIFGFAKK